MAQEVVRVVYAVETATVALPDGSTYTIHKGQRYSTDLPVVRHAPGWFSTDPSTGMTQTAETATAIPGEQRHVRRG